jgi:phosphate transport system permease protein
MRSFLTLSAIVTASIVVGIALFLLYFSLPLLEGSGLEKTIVGGGDGDLSYGVLPALVGTLWISLLSTLFALFISLFTSMGLESLSGKRYTRFVESFYEILSSIPTVVYAFLGIVLLLPHMRALFGGSGMSILSASIVLSLVISPTMILYFRESFSTVPREYRVVVYSLGGDEGSYIRRVLLPFRAKSLKVGTIMGFARASGDTMVSLMLAGNSLEIPISPLDGARTLTTHIALLFAEDFDSAEFRSIFVAGLILMSVTISIIVSIRKMGAKDVG